MMLSLMISSYLGVAFLYFGGSCIAYLPRIVFNAYPVIFLLAALTLSTLNNYIKGLGWGKFSNIVPWTLLTAIFVLNNIDAFGYPQMYYLFQFPDPWYFMEMWNKWYPPQPISWW
jgi:hypothetical protein